MNRLWIIGPPGAGKSYLASILSEQLHIHSYELDEFYWLANWERRTDEVFKKIVINLTSDKSWIIDGFYPQVQEQLYLKSSLIILVKKPILTLMYRVLIRSIKRIIFKKEVCGGNFENISFLFSRNGLFRYTIDQYNHFNKDLNFNTSKVVIVKDKNDIKNVINHLNNSKNA